MQTCKARGRRRSPGPARVAHRSRALTPLGVCAECPRYRQHRRHALCPRGRPPWLGADDHHWCGCGGQGGAPDGGPARLCATCGLRAPPTRRCICGTTVGGVQPPPFIIPSSVSPGIPSSSMLRLLSVHVRRAAFLCVANDPSRVQALHCIASRHLVPFHRVTLPSWASMGGPVTHLPCRSGIPTMIATSPMKTHQRRILAEHAAGLA